MTSPATAPLLDRQGEMAAIDSLSASVLANVPGGRAALVVVRGEAGIGKSSLVAAATSRLAAAGHAVLRAALSEVESNLGWAGLRLLCRDVADDELAALAPGVRDAIPAAIGRSGSSDADPNIVAFALADLLERRLAAGPVAVVVDDLHWLDAPTAGALAFAIRSNADRPLLVVCAHRPVDLPIEPARLLDDDRRLEVELAGLSVAGVNRLLRTRLDVGLDRSDVVRVHATTGGSPLHALEIGRLLRRGVALGDALVHPSAYDMILARIEMLPLATRSVLLASALSARPTIDRLRLALPDTDIASELEPALKQQLIEVHGGAVVFTHPLARSATVAEAGGTARRSMQLALAATTEDDEERIDLLVAATDRPDAALAADLDTAVERASARGDMVAALRLARRAADLTPPTSAAEKAERLLTAAELAAASGDGVAPVVLAEQAERLDDTVDVAFRAGVIKIMTIGNRGDTMDALAVSDAVLLRLDGHPAKRARIYDLRSQGSLRFDVALGLEAARQAVEEAIAGGDEDQIERERALLAMVSVLAGEPVDLDAIQAKVTTLPDTAIAKDWYADTLSFCDRSRAALAISTQQLGAYQRLGLVHFEAPVRSRMVGDLLALGRYADAIRAADEWLDMQSLVGGVAPGAITADRALARVLLGDTAGGIVDYDRCVVDPVNPLDGIALLTRGAQIAAALGDWAIAAERSTQARSITHEVHYRGLGCAPFRIEGVEALVQLGRIAEAAELGAEHIALARHSGEPRGVPDTARIEAMLAAANGDAATAVTAWERAIDGYERIELPLDHGIALLGLGGALRRTGKRAEAKRWLDAAADVFGEIRAAPYLARITGELERMGAKRGAEANELTPTERQVADLVASGLSNAEIASSLMVSVRTVESNLTRAYRKLGVRRRTELAAVLRNTA